MIAGHSQDTAHTLARKSVKDGKNNVGIVRRENSIVYSLTEAKNCLKEKRRLFSGLDLTIITPSQWLADLVKQSFLKDYFVKVIHNGIDLSVFKPTESDFRKKHQIKDNQCVLLGVAFGWGKGKDWMFLSGWQRNWTEKICSH